MVKQTKKEADLLPSTQEDFQPNFNNIATRIFEDKKGKILIGSQEIKPEVLDILREQARYLETSQLYEILLATLKNEAANLALIQSTNWDHVNYAKSLWHVAFVLENLISSLKPK